MNKLEIAKKLAQITGKPITEFFNEEKNESKSILCNEKIKNSEECSNNKVAPVIKEDHPEELIKYRNMFKGSKIVNGHIMNGRQMTRKEYLKYTRNMTEEEYFKHPLMYKIFRAEGQLDPNFLSFSNRFKKNENKK